MPIEDNCQSANKRIIAHISTENQNIATEGQPQLWTGHDLSLHAAD